MILNQVKSGTNVASVLFQEQEGSYLAGALATLVAKDTSIKGMSGKPIIGVIGGTKSVGIDKFIVGYIQGARAVDPDGRGEGRLFQQFRRSRHRPADGQGDVRARAPTSSIRSPAAPASASSRRPSRPANSPIGVDTDQDGLAPGPVLTSMIKRTDVAVETVIKDYADHKFPGGQTVTLGLKQDGVGLSRDEIHQGHDPAADLAKVEDMKKQDPVRRDQGLERGRSGLSGLLQVRQ